MKNIFKNKKYTLVISIISTILVLGLAGTYAWYVWSTSDEDVTKIATGVGVATVSYDAGADIIGSELIPVSDKSKGIVKNIRVRTDIDATSKLSFNLYLDVNEIAEELKHESFRYEVWKDGVEEAIATGNFSQESLNTKLVSCTKNSTNHIVLLSGATINKTVSNYTLYIWIDGENYDNPYEMSNKNFNFTLHADGQNALLSESMINYTEGTLASYIANLYNDSTDVDVVANNGVNYYYDNDNKLMSDNFDNIRYYGKDANNYVYFNCSDYTNQSSSTCEKWRIIGIVDGKVKIVRNDPIGEYSWDLNSDSSYDNNWNDATINKLLNDGYYNNKDGYMFYNGFTETTSGDLVETTINFATSGVGLKNDMTRDLISESTWYLGGYSSPDVYSNQVYVYEREHRTHSDISYDTRWTGNVGLLYLSDYGYATDFRKCTSTFGNYDENCTNDKWLNYNYGWFITPNIAYSIRAFRTGSDGTVGSNAVYLLRSIFPTVYLDENIINYAGIGTSSYPYKIYPTDKVSDLEKGNAVSYISNLYLNNKSKVVTNNSTEYQYSESVNLMNDRLGGTTDDYDAGNIRYYGANPNNYVDLGDNEINSNGKKIPTLYRIIGVFKDVELDDGTKKDLIKVIRADSIGEYSWDNKTDGIGSSVSSYGSNDWSDARLMMLLNPGYDIYNEENPLLDESGDILYGYEGSLWWNSKSGTCYYGSSNKTKTCDFTSTGLSSNVQNKIETVVWKLGSNNETSIFPDEMYNVERGTIVDSGRPTQSTGKIAVMYTSDYGYATDFNNCRSTIYNYGSSGCYSNDWLYNGKYQWQLTPYLSTYAARQLYSKYVDGNNPVYEHLHVRPVFYLNSELDIESGEGTIEEPYVLG